MAFRKNNTYKYESGKTFKLSRSGIDSFIKCQRCFYLNKVGNIKDIGMPGFSLNSAHDELMKKELDIYRKKGEAHPYMESLERNLIPFQHEKMEDWRNNFKGVTYLHEDLKLHLFGAVDDVWVNLDNNELIVVDYKSTSKNSEITLDADWQIGYKRQMEFYQYLLRRNGFKVSDTGYFVYCNGIKEKDMFDERLDFDIYLLDYTGNDSWIESTLVELHKTLNQDNTPDYTEGCEFCRYQKEVSDY